MLWCPRHWSVRIAVQVCTLPAQYPNIDPYHHRYQSLIEYVQSTLLCYIPNNDRLIILSLAPFRDYLDGNNQHIRRHMRLFRPRLPALFRSSPVHSPLLIYSPFSIHPAYTELAVYRLPHALQPVFVWSHAGESQACYQIVPSIHIARSPEHTNSV